MNPQVDAFLNKAPAWREEMARLREIILEHDVGEELKWGKPCYTCNGGNVLIVQPFKHYVALMFCQGALLHDARELLVQPGQSTQAGRQLRFAKLEEIEERVPIVQAYIREALEAAKAGLQVEFKQNPEPVPSELQAKLDADPAFKAAFEGLTPGRQRAYILQISGAKQSATRAARVEKYAPQILAGKGLRD
ncbi:MAG: hypothetical protein E1N59_2584 [Puniceicoccaceae bacterium 5H]|nr:MAG: hypothetical protein E1N59_2584 [Puniceicoccaceae bacterium 5H]